MNNHIYTTKAIIIKSALSSEANKLYYLFTEDFGLILAIAQGIRLEKSKLKGHLLDFSLSSISLVKGKEFWRITSAEIIEKPGFLRNEVKVSIVKNIFSLVLRLIHGEEKNEQLFETIENFFQFLQKTDLPGEKVKQVEAMIVLRILFSLGYVKKNLDLEEFASGTQINEEILENFKGKNKIAVQEINEALSATHLI